jgi:hypothetical protein
MRQVGFKPTIPVFEQANIFHALDHAITVLGSVCYRNMDGQSVAR